MANYVSDGADIVAGLWRTRRIELATLGAAVVLGAYFGWEIVDLAFFVLFVATFLFPIGSKLLAGGALFFLATTPILLASGRSDQAESYAVYAYYLLVMAVIRGIIELREEKREVSSAETVRL